MTDRRLLGAPTADELSLVLRGFLIRLMALDAQLEDNQGGYLMIDAKFLVVYQQM